MSILANNSSLKIHLSLFQITIYFKLCSQIFKDSLSLIIDQEFVFYIFLSKLKGNLKKKYLEERRVAVV
jgi:hypothetical protein